MSKGKIAVLLALLILGSCGFGVPDFVLNVIFEEGVTGTPEAGTHEYAELDIVSYDYEPIDPIHTVEVITGTSRLSASGVLTMYADHEIRVRLVDIRGTWDVIMVVTDTSETAFEFTLTISGSGRASGTFSDSRGYNGLWTAENDIVTLTYTDWSDFVLTGSVFDMNGAYEGAGTTGSWNAESTDSSRQYTTR